MGITSLEVPLELINDQLTLRIPLAAGGNELAPFARGLGTTDGEYLTVVIQPWQAELLRVGEGSRVIVDNEDDKFNITRSAWNDA